MLVISAQGAPVSMQLKYCGRCNACATCAKSTGRSDSGGIIAIRNSGCPARETPFAAKTPPSRRIVRISVPVNGPELRRSWPAKRHPPVYQRAVLQTRHLARYGREIAQATESPRDPGFRAGERIYRAADGVAPAVQDPAAFQQAQRCGTVTAEFVGIHARGPRSEATHADRL